MFNYKQSPSVIEQWITGHSAALIELTSVVGYLNAVFSLLRRDQPDCVSCHEEQSKCGPDLSITTYG